eukprot:13674.XXX_624130_624285_1 [CDS] Oithona nana genome sequencing.
MADNKRLLLLLEKLCNFLKSASYFLQASSTNLRLQGTIYIHSLKMGSKQEN